MHGEETPRFTLVHTPCRKKSNQEFGSWYLALNSRARKSNCRTRQTAKTHWHRKVCHGEDGACSWAKTRSSSPETSLPSMDRNNGENLQTREGDEMCWYFHTAGGTPGCTRKITFESSTWTLSYFRQSRCSQKSKYIRISFRSRSTKQALRRAPSHRAREVRNTRSLTRTRSTLWTWMARRRTTSSSTKRSTAASSASTRSPRSTSKRSSTWTGRNLRHDSRCSGNNSAVDTKTNATNEVATHLKRGIPGPPDDWNIR